MSRDFYELCYDQYKLEMADADGLYQKAGVLLVVVSLLGTVIVSLGRIDVVDQCFIRVDVFIFYLATLVAILLLAASVIYLVLLSYPRSDYMTLKSMDAWQTWREEYEKQLKQHENDTSNSPVNIDKVMFAQLCPRLAEAQPVNAKINEARRKMFQRSIRMAAISLIAIGIQGLFALLLALQGI